MPLLLRAICMFHFYLVNSISWYSPLYKVITKCTFLFKVDGCENYTVLSEADRSLENNGRRVHKGTVWYRWGGAHRDRIPDKCALKGQCDTDYSGWLKGAHPSVTEGAVTRKVCFSGYKFCCLGSHSIQVKNCSSYYVYELNRQVVNKILRSCGSESAGKLTCCLLCISH